MKILWFTGNGALYSNTNKYNGGGWVAALARKIFEYYPNIELSMAIPWNEYFCDKQENITFYGIPNIKHSFINYNNKLSKQLTIIKQIVDDCHPDIIHVFGSEHTGGMVSTVTNIPVVIHIQGILTLLEQTWLPYNMSWGKYILWHYRHWFQRKWLKQSCKTERKILASCHHYMGRTEMDQSVISFLSPNCHYYYCSEMLRPQIYESNKVWTFHNKREKKRIISIISSPIYKGGDVILRAANILKQYNMDFEWHVYGIQSMYNWERLTHLSANNINVKIGGIITAEQLVNIVTDADVLVHPSYIENSPNTVCEAQLLGIPVIATHVGGTASLINHKNNGILVPANDMFAIATYILRLCTDINLAKSISYNGRQTALKRHSPKQIVDDVVTIYQKILQK